ncbi:MAG TPA: GNAT family N-acetyltransferase [Gammaproteobacteria bacterium]|nr:GNAT family N-acetyltransferase [Gammaproteobacteria bacterium]
MTINFHIVKNISNLALLQNIEKRAAEQFKSVGYDSSNWSMIPLESLKRYCDDQRLWVAVNDEHLPIGFAAIDIYNPYIHLEELDVDPVFQQQGVASALLKEVITLAQQLKVKAITLRTFKTTAWSVQLYKKFGFKITDEKSNHILTMINNEMSIGLPLADRITMILRCLP